MKTELKSAEFKPWALITGAAKRIGRAIALDLARAGWNIIVHYHTSQADALALAEDIRSLGSEACLAEIDLTQGKMLPKFVATLADTFSSFQVLVNNAGLFEKDCDDPTGQKHWAINYEAPRILNEAFGTLEAKPFPRMIVNILDADPSKAPFSAYNKSKIALHDLTLKHALQLAPGTRVHGIGLGPVIPSPRESLEHFAMMVNHSPLKRQAFPEDVARAVRFLIETPSMTGNILWLDGGLHLTKAEHEIDNRQLTKLSN